ncbi:RNA-binding S4 domain-containing protein [Membranihabitans maritimus]|uniref:RNA-binding S4 domain-containing protein n=1 Tax=Membranihabitans maritimus TaxID=2904244 RepID=UPI001F1FC312|nr:RNA-binding S4 domain-containing protein [Membranihabitans maritimus]
MEETRIDKWLWAVRIFKSRTQANNATKKGHISINGEKVKPSSTVTVGDNLTVKKNGFIYEFTVDKIIDKRVGAPIAITCYTDNTPEEELNKFNKWYVGKSKGEFREKGLGRPTKKDRREIEGFKDIEDL